MLGSQGDSTKFAFCVLWSRGVLSLCGSHCGLWSTSNLQPLTSCHTDIQRLSQSPQHSLGTGPGMPQRWMLRSLIENGAVFTCSIFICILNLSRRHTTLSRFVLCENWLWIDEKKGLCVLSRGTRFSLFFTGGRFVSRSSSYWFAP